MFRKIIFTVCLGFVFIGQIQAAQAQMPDPCPAANLALSDTPDDLSKVQADIDRFTLCVERAQLLQRLNDLALENEQTLLGTDASNPGFQLDPPPAPNFQMMREELLTKNSPKEEEPLPAEENLPEAYLNGDWVILNIFGSGGDLSGKLAKRDGSFAQVKSGDVLAGGIEIVEITPVSVKVADGGKNRLLVWLEGAE